MPLRRARRVRTERRGDPSRAGLSDAPVPAGLGGQHLDQVVAAARSQRQAVLHARGDVEVQRSHHQDRQGAIFTFTMEAKSVITFPSGEMRLPGPGFYEITGLAWSGRGKIARVEISTDGGKTWGLAALQDPALPICQTRFRFPWVWDEAPATLQSRATDETGYTQPTHQQLIAERRPLDAPGMLFYHMNAIQSWGVAPDGSVKNVHPLG